MPNKNTIQNLALVAFLALLFFTPMGTFVKVQMSRLLAFSPKTIAATDQKQLSTYHWQLMDKNGKTV
jgi:hypothetical protein